MKAILFYDSSCRHCQYVVAEVLVSMIDDYGGQLQVIGINTSQLAGVQLHRAAIERYQVPPRRQGTPTLVVGDAVLVGGREISEQFPALVEDGLAAGGMGWPDIPGLAQVLPTEVQQEPSPTAEPQAADTGGPTPARETAAKSAPTFTPVLSQAPISATIPTLPRLSIGSEEPLSGEAQMRPPDPVGLTLASVVLAGMTVALGYTALRVATARRHLFQLDGRARTCASTWAILLFCLMGLGVSGYIAYAEMTQVEAFCGPIGECNIVQSSPYARILGIPVAVPGMLNYLALGVLCVLQRHSVGRLASLSALGLLGLTALGTIFSIYLTCLEIFVIHAICAWCLGSAVITAMLMLLVAIPITRSPSVT